MKWFKHFSDNHRGKSMQFLFDEMGHVGMSSWYILMEMCAEKLERKTDKSLEDSDCLFEFHERVVRQNLRISATNLRRMLDICQTFNLLSVEFRENLIKIKMPILLDLLEYDQKKSRQRRATIVVKKRLDTDTDTDTDTYVSQNTKRPDKKLNSEIWNAYKEGYLKRYKVEPVRNASVNAKISQLAKRLGADAVGVILFYTEHNNQFYSKHMHAIGLCLKDAEALHTQWKTGRSFEPTSQFARKKIDYDEVAALIVSRGGSIE